MELNHHQRYLVEEFVEDYQECRLGRREMLRKVLIVTGSVAGAATVLMTLGCGSGDDAPVATATNTTAPPTATTAPATSVRVAADDPAIQGADVKFPGPASDLLGYIARPKADGRYPAIVLIHENRGLLDHFKDVSRRYAKEGIVALAVDLASRRGGSTTDTNANMGAVSGAAPNDLVADLLAYTAYLKQQPAVIPTALGVSGFCFGGGYTWELAIASPEIKAAVPYYGSVRLKDQLGQTNAAILAIYGANDARITGESGDIEARLRAAGKTVQVKVYDGANHAFFNDTGGSYNEAAATDAWKLTVDWFKKYLVA